MAKKSSKPEQIESVEQVTVNTQEPQVIDFSDEYPEFTTPVGAKFERFYSSDFLLFPETPLFDNGTAPFCSRSYSIEGDNTSKILINLSKDGVYFLIKNERSMKSGKLIFNLEEGLKTLATLPLSISQEFLKNLELL